MHFRVFFKVKVQNVGYYFGLIKFHFFLSAKIPDIFGGER